jgi:hypothetical protein
LRNFHLACELRIDHHQFRTSSTRSSLDWHRFGISPSSLLIVIFLVSDSRCLCLSKNHHSLVRLAACSHLLDDPSVAVSLSLVLRRFIVSCQIAPRCPSEYSVALLAAGRCRRRRVLSELAARSEF